MTNEQLYVLLEWIADSLATEIVSLKSHLTGVEGIERKPNFYDEDGYQKTGFFEGWQRKDIEDYAKEHDFEVRFDGDIVILDGLCYLLRRVRERSRALR